MADRSHSHTNGSMNHHNHHPHASRQPPIIQPRTTSATLAGVRRNLFQGQGQQQHIRARRPAQQNGVGGASSHHHHHHRSPENTIRPDADVDVTNTDAGEIVVRDRHGEIEWGEPPSPDLDGQEELPPEIHQQEIEEERQRLAEAVRSHQINSSAMAEQPEELLEAVRINLRSKVAALAEDNWMYEPEEQGRMT